MKALPLSSFLTVAVLFFLVPLEVQAQAWVSYKDEALLSFSYQYLGTDERSSTRSQVFVLNGDVGITQKLTFNGAINYVATRFTGSGRAHNPGVDNGTWNTSFQDARIGVRYKAYEGSDWMLTPSAALVLPVTDYPVSGHASLGLGLKELQLGLSAGKLLTFSGVPRAYVESSFTYAFMENAEAIPHHGLSHTLEHDLSQVLSDEVTIDRTQLRWELGYFLFDSVTVQFFGTWQNTLGGIQFNAVTVNGIENHDQVAEADLILLGGGVSFPIGDALDLYVAYNDMVWRVNSHDARALTFGMTWGFNVRSLFGRPSDPTDDDEN